MNDDEHLVIHFNNGAEMGSVLPRADQEFTWRARGSRQEDP